MLTTRMQALIPGPGGGGGVGDVLVKMIRQEGFSRPIRGMGAVVVGAGPAHALYFSCYEFLKNKMMNQRLPSQFNHLVYGAAGCVATVLHDGVMNPAEVVKQRLQMYNSPYKTVTSCMRHVYKTEGLYAFYRSYTTQLAMNVPFQCVHFIAYEFGQSITNPDHSYNPRAHVISGAMAGAIAAATTTPLDVCKTVLNTQQGGVQAQGMVDAFKQVYRFGGIQGYFRGLTARIIYQMPATAICWSTYEFFKYALHSRQDDTHGLDANDGINGIGQSQAISSSSVAASAVAAGATSPRSNSFQGAGLYFNNKTSGPVLLEVTRS
ncbi:mitoferrin-2 isoform X2 [Cephus cinctus]|uniref:Mitoferrin-2 isoform X2 n=1 Tax=Cephus cinctus TaxID=211228 RepID=A0AAJ7VWW8_CEPCN|nr:mitoferrin-2 isoform X2 [Cephus cinctus]XP_024936230.1 mitoferrin-2 isoform X2 [Cephus cinctus]